MFENIDFVSLIAGIIAIIGVIGTFIKSAEAKRYLGAVQMSLDVVGEYLRSNADGVFTEEEYNAIGKKFVAVAKQINNDTTIPVEITTGA